MKDAFWSAKIEMAQSLMGILKNDKSVPILKKEPDEERIEWLTLSLPAYVFGEISYHNEDMTRFWVAMKFRGDDGRYDASNRDCDVLIEVSLETGKPVICVHEMNFKRVRKFYRYKTKDEAIRGLAVNAIAGFNDHCCQYFDNNDFFNSRQENPRRFLYPYVDDKIIEGYSSC